MKLYIFSRKRKVPDHITTQQTILEKKTLARSLGNTLDNKLMKRDYIEYVVKKTVRVINILKQKAVIVGEWIQGSHYFYIDHTSD